jgi:hypothetical protein
MSLTNFSETQKPKIKMNPEFRVKLLEILDSSRSFEEAKTKLERHNLRPGAAIRFIQENRGSLWNSFMERHNRGEISAATPSPSKSVMSWFKVTG